MNNKKCRLFLWISLIFFICSVIAVLGCYIVGYYQLKAQFPNDTNRIMEDLGWALVFGILFIFPVFPLELSWIRCVYKILKYEPKGIVKICYMMSAILASLALVLDFLIVFIGIGNGSKFSETIVLWTEWPVFLLSFVLGSIPIKHDILPKISKTQETTLCINKN